MRTSPRRRARPSRRAVLALGAGFGGAIVAGSGARAQTFPQSRPITLIVPFPAGGGTDIIARNLAEQMRERLGQAIVVENRGGGGGTIAAQAVARAAPDGHTLFLVTSTFVTAAAVTPDLPYDIVRDFTPIAMLGRGPMVVVVGNNLGISSIAQLIERARAQPEALNFVSSGLGSVTHLAGELFMQRTGTRMTHIPYRGGAPAVTDLLAGHGHVFFSTVPTILGQIQGGTVRLIAVTGRTRSALFPDTPTVMEAGVRDYDVGTWWGVVAPRGLPDSIRATLNTIINESAASPAIQRRFHEEGAESFRGTPQDFANALEGELTSWRNVVREGGLRAQ